MDGNKHIEAPKRFLITTDYLLARLNCGTPLMVISNVVFSVRLLSIIGLAKAASTALEPVANPINVNVQLKSIKAANETRVEFRGITVLWINQTAVYVNTKHYICCHFFQASKNRDLVL